MVYAFMVHISSIHWWIKIYSILYYQNLHGPKYTTDLNIPCRLLHPCMHTCQERKKERNKQTNKDTRWNLKRPCLQHWHNNRQTVNIKRQKSSCEIDITYTLADFIPYIGLIFIILADNMNDKYFKFPILNHLPWQKRT